MSFSSKAFSDSTARVGRDRIREVKGAALFLQAQALTTHLLSCFAGGFDGGRQLPDAIQQFLLPSPVPLACFLKAVCLQAEVVTFGG